MENNKTQTNAALSAYRVVEYGTGFDKTTCTIHARSLRAAKIMAERNRHMGYTVLVIHNEYTQLASKVGTGRNVRWED